MNKTDIDWTDYTLNVITGCRGPAGDGRHCPYCYAKRLAHGRLRRLYLANRTYVVGDPSDPFAPRFWPKRLEEPARLKKPSKIFVCSMGEPFGPWLPESWQRAVFKMIEQNPRHTFQLLTHQPKNLTPWSPFPPNAWVGATATNAQELITASIALFDVEASVRFVSLEPLLSPVDWIIVGAQTGPGARPPKREWVEDILDAAARYDIPVLLKRNLHWPAEHQEWPRNHATRTIFFDLYGSSHTGTRVYGSAS